MHKPHTYVVNGRRIAGKAAERCRARSNKLSAPTLPETVLIYTFEMHADFRDASDLSYGSGECFGGVSDPDSCSSAAKALGLSWGLSE